MKTITLNLYTIDEHPAPEKCYEWVRNNWHELHESQQDELIASLKAIAARMGCTLNYALSPVPDRGEMVSMHPPGGTPAYSMSEWRAMEKESLECSFTGCTYDGLLADAINGAKHLNFRSVEFRFSRLALDAAHAIGDDVYSDYGIHDMCEANGYYFLEDGTMERLAGVEA